MKYLRVWQAGLLIVVFVVWHLLTTPGLLPTFMFDNDRQAAFFFGEPLKIFADLARQIPPWYYTEDYPTANSICSAEIQSFLAGNKDAGAALLAAAKAIRAKTNRK